MSAYVGWRRVVEATEANCTCGGMGPNDPGVCPACVIYHRLKAHALKPCLEHQADEEDMAT